MELSINFIINTQLSVGFLQRRTGLTVSISTVSLADTCGPPNSDVRQHLFKRENPDIHVAFTHPFPLATRPALSHPFLMQSHEILRDVLQQCSPKQVAAQLGLSVSMIYKWAEPS